MGQWSNASFRRENVIGNVKTIMTKGQQILVSTSINVIELCVWSRGLGLFGAVSSILPSGKNMMSRGNAAVIVGLP